MAKLFVNSGDPDQTPRSAASDLGLHCLPITLLRVSRLYDASTLVDQFVSSPREREKRDKRDSRNDDRGEQGRKRNRTESEETRNNNTPPLPLPATRIAGLAQL